MANFSFLDQFSDIEIDLSGFYEDYGIEFNNNQGNIVTVKNIFEVTKFDLYGLTDNTTFFKYAVQNNDSPETIAKNYYGNVDFWWLVILPNNVINPLTDWILSDTQIYDIAVYLSENQNRLSFNGYYNILQEQNEAKRTIYLLKRSHVQKFLLELRDRV